MGRLESFVVLACACLSAFAAETGPAKVEGELRSPTPPQVVLHWGAFEIRLLTAPIPSGDADAGAVSAAIQVMKAGKQVARLGFDRLEPAGGNAGFSLPSRQPLKDLFLVSVDGNEQSKIVAVTPASNILVLPQGQAWEVEGGKYLLLIQSPGADSGKLSAVDLGKWRVAAENLSADSWLAEQSSYVLAKTGSGSYVACKKGTVAGAVVFDPKAPGWRKAGPQDKCAGSAMPPVSMPESWKPLSDIEL